MATPVKARRLEAEPMPVRAVRLGPRDVVSERRPDGTIRLTSPHALAPDGLELAVLAPQLMGDTPRAVGRELSDDLLDGSLQISLVALDGAVIPTAARQS